MNDIKDGFIKTKDYQIYYKIKGTISKDSTPLIILHGGPGGSLYSYEPLFDLENSKMPVIMYNQHGSYKSDIFIEDKSSLYTIDSFMDELDIVIKELKINKFYLLGHSWGGMLALSYAIKRKNKNMLGLILFSTLPSTKMWNSESLRLVEYYPPKMREEISKSRDIPEYSSPLLKKAIKRFMKEHVRDKDKVSYVYKIKPVKYRGEAYKYMWGESELFGSRTLKDYNLENDLYLIDYRTLIISGANDESTPYINKFMHDRIKNSTWVLLKDSSHTGYLTETDKVIDAIQEFTR